MPKSRKRQKKKAKPEDQHAQFVETARRLGADMDEETFKRAIENMSKDKTERMEKWPFFAEFLDAKGVVLEVYGMGVCYLEEAEFSAEAALEIVQGDHPEVVGFRVVRG